MRNLVRALSLSVLAAAGSALAGCGGGGSEVHAGAGVITITAFAPLAIPGGVPTPFTITGTNYETVTGTTAQVIFHALGGATPFFGGTSDTATVIGLVTTDTTITGTTPAATVCGVAAISFEVTVILESGVKSNTFTTAGLVFTPPTVTSVTPSSIPAEIPTLITVNGTGFGPVGGSAIVRFISDGGFVLFGDASQSETDVVGSITSATAISVTAPLAAVCGAASRTASIAVTLGANGSCSTPGASVLTYTAPVIASTSITSTAWFANTPFTITGSGFGTTGSQVTLRLSNAGGLSLYEDGSKTTTDVVGTITSSTTIDGVYPRVTHCVRTPGVVGGTPATVTSVIRGIFPAGSCADSPASFVTHRLPQLTTFSTPAGGLIPATLATPVTILGTDVGPAGGSQFPMTVVFRTNPALTIFEPNALGVGTSFTGERAGLVSASGTAMFVSSPVTEAIPADQAGIVRLEYEDGSCSNSIACTFIAPPAITSIVNNAPPFNQAGVATLQDDRFLSVISTQMNVNGTNFQAGATVLLTNAANDAPIAGTGLLSTPVVTPPLLITGGSPADATLPNGNLLVNVRVTNPDGQFTTAQTLYTSSNVRPNFNASFDTGTNSENQIAVNPANALNAVSLAHQIATAGFANMTAAVTIDGGLTWTTLLIGNTQDGIAQTFRGDPMVGFDAFGNCYMNYISTGGGTDRVMLIQFAPAGGVVTAAILGALAANVVTIQSNPAAGLAQDRNTLSIGGPAATQTIACGHIDFTTVLSDGRCAAFTSTGPGVLSAITGPVTVATGTATRFVQHFAPCVGPQGQVYVSWIDEDNTNQAATANVNFTGDFDGVTGGLAFGAAVLVGTSDLGFRTFFSAQPNRGNGAVPMSVAINTGAKVGRIVITYTDEVPAVLAGGASGAPIANNTVVVTQFSDTQGLTWSPKTFVRPATLDHHFLPWLAVDKANGNCYVTWKETADQPTKNQSARLCASATDGNTWNAPLRISQGLATPFVAFGGAAGDYLEYEGIAVHNHRCYAVWADNANFTATGATANPHGTTTSDAYVTVFQHKP